MADPKHKANPLFPAMEYRSMDKAFLLVHCPLQSESPNRADAIRIGEKQISQSDAARSNKAENMQKRYPNQL